jgi:hypothetical protein
MRGRQDESADGISQAREQLRSPDEAQRNPEATRKSYPEFFYVHPGYAR